MKVDCLKMIRTVWQALIQWQCTRNEIWSSYVMARRKKIIFKQLQCSTQEVQYAEATIKKRSRLWKKYDNIINTYIKMGYAKKLRWEETCKVSEKTCYLPQHPMFNKNKPEDAAAEYNGNSLNKILWIF